MARPSFHPKDTFKGRSDVAEGLTEIIGIKSLIHQFSPNKKTGEQQPPTTGVLVEFQPLNINGELAGDPVEKYYKAGDVTKENDDGEEVLVLLPSIGDSDEPVENEVGAEGDTFWCQDKWAPNSNTQWSVFSFHLVKCGFNEERVMSSKLPELIGTVGEIKNEQKTANIGGKKTDWNVPVFKSITEYPYDSKKSAKAKSKNSTAAPADTNSGGGDVDEKATQVLMQVIRAQEKQTVSIASVRRDMMGVLMDEKLKSAQIKPITKKLDDEVFMAEAGEFCGFEVKGKSLVLAGD